MNLREILMDTLELLAPSLSSPKEEVFMTISLTPLRTNGATGWTRLSLSTLILSKLSLPLLLLLLKLLDKSFFLRSELKHRRVFFMLVPLVLVRHPL